MDSRAAKPENKDGAGCSATRPIFIFGILGDV